MNFIKKFIILNFNQFGFIADNNKSDALMEFLDNEYEAMNKSKVVLVFFSKALDTVVHEILLRNVEFYGFTGRTLQWQSSFLSDRTQFIELGNKRSSLCKIIIGVP